MATSTADLSGYTEEQRDQLLAATTGGEYEEMCRRFDAENAQAALDAEDQDPAAELRAQIDAAHERNGTTPPPRIGNVDEPVLEDDRDDAAKLAGGDEVQRHPQAADEQPQPDAGLVLRGEGTLNWSVGGKKPNTSDLTLTGGKVDVEGQFAKGQTIVLRVHAVVREVAFKDKADSKTGQVTDAVRSHKARITSLSVLED